MLDFRRKPINLDNLNKMEKNNVQFDTFELSL